MTFFFVLLRFGSLLHRNSHNFIAFLLEIKSLRHARTKRKLININTFTHTQSLLRKHILS